MPQWPRLCSQATTGSVFQRSPWHHSAQALSRIWAALLSSWITCLLRVRGENLPVMIPCHRQCHCRLCSCTHFVWSCRVESSAAASPRALGRGFPEQQSRVRLCSRHIPGGCVCAWSLRNPGHCFELQLLIATSRLP